MLRQGFSKFFKVSFRSLPDKVRFNTFLLRFAAMTIQIHSISEKPSTHSLRHTPDTEQIAATLQTFRVHELLHAIASTVREGLHEYISNGLNPRNEIGFSGKYTSPVTPDALAKTLNSAIDRLEKLFQTPSTGTHESLALKANSQSLQTGCESMLLTLVHGSSGTGGGHADVAGVVSEAIRLKAFSANVILALEGGEAVEQEN